MSIECPTCDGGFDSERARNIHHKMAHGESINYIECEECGSEFQRLTTDSKFCSHECRGEYYSGEMSPRWESRISLVCQHCDEEFEVLPHEENRTFCSRECTDEHLRSREGEKNPAWNRDESECYQCGEIFAHVSHLDSKFCSMGCYNQYKVGENHPNWKGGHIKWYGTEWEEIAEEVRSRDGYECRSCGGTNEENGRKLSVHHIVPIRKFDSREDANKMSNLVTLCRPCHHRIEAGNKECPKP